MCATQLLGLHSKDGVKNMFAIHFFAPSIDK